MKSNQRWVYQQASSPVPPSPDYNFFTEQARRAGYAGPELGRARHEHFQYYHHNQQRLRHHLQPQFQPRPSLSLHAHDMHEAMWREFEKEQIREEIIMSEIVRRRALEAEVRRELMLERELALRRGNDGYPFGSSPVMDFDSRSKIQLLGMEKLNIRHENGVFETSPFQRGNTGLRVSEVKPVSEGGKEKKNIILLAKPDGSISGSKRKAATPPPTTETPSDNIPSKKAKEEWSCALCHVSATSQQGLDEHLRGKKHKSKQAALKGGKAGKNYRIGLFPEKAKKSIDAGRTVDPVMEDESALSKKNGEGNLNAEKNQPVVVQNKGDKKHRFWCEICQVGAHCMKVMNSHKKGKKHMGRLERINRNKESEQSYQKKIEHGKNTTPKNVHEATDEARSVDHEPVEAAVKLKDPEAVAEARAEEPEPANEAEPDAADEANAS